MDWGGFDGIYFYNPFFGDEISIRRAEKKLWELRPNARVITYHGFGGSMPDGFRLLAQEPAGTGQLEVWASGCCRRTWRKDPRDQRQVPSTQARPGLQISPWQQR